MTTAETAFMNIDSMRRCMREEEREMMDTPGKCRPIIVHDTAVLYSRQFMTQQYIWGMAISAAGGQKREGEGVPLAHLGITQDLVGLCDFLEFFLSSLPPAIAHASS